MVCGRHETINKLIQFARTYRYTTSIPPVFATAGLMALEILHKETWRIDKLQNLIAYFNQQAKQLRPDSSPTAIQAFTIGDEKKALSLQEKLATHGFLVGCLRAPSVPINNSIIRITLTVEHTETQIDRLLEFLDV